MQKHRNSSDLFKIHVAVLLFGAAGLFGKFLDMHPILIVLGRVVFASLALLIFATFSTISLKLKQKKDYFLLSVQGGLLAFHWVSFFHSIQLSTVAIGLLTYSAFPLFVTFFEPLLFKEKIRSHDILIASITLFGILIIVPEFNRSNHISIAIFWGLLSAISFALLSMLNRKYVRDYSGITIAFYQDGIAALLLLPFLLVLPFTISGQSFWLILLLGIVFTALSHTLFISGLKQIRTQTASIIASLEPVYGILLGLLFLHEIPGLRTLVGGTVILSAVVWSSLKK